MSVQDIEDLVYQKIGLENENRKLRSDLEWAAEQYRALAKFLGVDVEREFDERRQVYVLRVEMEVAYGVVEDHGAAVLCNVADILNRKILESILEGTKGGSRLTSGKEIEPPHAGKVDRWRKILERTEG